VDKAQEMSLSIILSTIFC